MYSSLSSSSDSVSSEGSFKTSSQKYQCAVYDFTYHDEPGWLTPDQMKEKLKKHCKRWCFQMEQGSTKHYQGRFSLQKKAYMKELPVLFGTSKWHFSVTSTRNGSSMDYVMKDTTRIQGPWQDNDPYIQSHVKDIEVKKWMQPVLESMHSFQPRLINVVCGMTGGEGKTDLTSLMEVNGAIRLIYQNDYKDLMSQVCAKSENGQKFKTYTLDVPRAIDQYKMQQVYSALEVLKDGMCYDPRYHWKEKKFERPNIWVFCNVAPDLSMLSMGRWCLFDIKNMQLMKRLSGQGQAPDTPLVTSNGKEEEEVLGVNCNSPESSGTTILEKPGKAGSKGGSPAKKQKIVNEESLFWFDE